MMPGAARGIQLSLLGAALETRIFAEKLFQSKNISHIEPNSSENEENVPLRLSLNNPVQCGSFLKKTIYQIEIHLKEKNTFLFIILEKNIKII